MSLFPAEIVVDGRDLEPPEPFEQTMAALERLAPEQKVRLLIGREPFPLYHALDLSGFAWQTGRTADGDIEVLIRRKT